MMKQAELSVFQHFKYVISSIVHLRKHQGSVLIFMFADFHADWLVKSVTLHHEMSQDSQCNHHAYTQKYKYKQTQTNTNTITSKNQIQMYICWLTGQECGIASWNLTGLPSVIISYNQGGSAQSTPPPRRRRCNQIYKFQPASSSDMRQSFKRWKRFQSAGNFLFQYFPFSCLPGFRLHNS